MAKGKYQSAPNTDSVMIYLGEMMMKELHPNQIGRLLRGAASDLGAESAQVLADAIIRTMPNRQAFVNDMLRRAVANANVGATESRLAQL